MVELPTPWNNLLLLNRSIDLTQIQLIFALSDLKDGNTFKLIFTRSAGPCVGTIKIKGKKRLYDGHLYYWLTNDSRRSFVKEGESILQSIIRP